MQTLSRHGALVHHTPLMGEFSCVQTSQISRMFAYANPAILDGDLVITADVDAYPTWVDDRSGEWQACNLLASP